MVAGTVDDVDNLDAIAFDKHKVIDHIVAMHEATQASCNACAIPARKGK